MSLWWDGHCYACGYLGKHGEAHRQRHFQAQVRKVEAFQAQHGKTRTTRQVNSGEWRATTWNQLCEEALACYRTLLTR